MHCIKCGQKIEPSASFCSECGERILSNQAPAACSAKLLSDSEQSFIDTTSRIAKCEKTAWSIFGALSFVGVVLIALYLICFFCGIVQMLINDDRVVGLNLVAFVYLLIIGVPVMMMLIATGIISIVKSAKITNYVKKMNSDFASVAEYFTKSGRIAMGAIFNSIGMIFAIINLSRIKANKETVDSIVAKQSNVF